MSNNDKPIFACVLRSGADFSLRDNFSVIDLEDLLRGLKKYVGTDIEIHCLTDFPLSELPASVTGVKLPQNWYGWWAKLCLFSPGIFPKGRRIIYFDLDTIITGDITPLIQNRGKMLASMPLKRQQGVIDYGLASGCMAWNAGELDFIYHDFDPELMAWMDRLPVPMIGDQGWIYRCVEENWTAIQSVQPGVYSYKLHCRDGIPEDCTILVFQAKPRPREAAVEREDIRRLLALE